MNADAPPSQFRSFHGNLAAVLSHGIVKERIVPPGEIDRTVERRRLFERNPRPHTHVEDRHMALRQRKTTSDAVEILNRRYFEGRPERLAILEEERDRFTHCVNGPD